jgi:hypothetical protein
MAKVVPAPQTRSFELSLRIRHPGMDPEAISNALGMAPLHAYKAGTPRGPRSNRVAASLHSESYWLAAIDPLQSTPHRSAPVGTPLRGAEVALERVRLEMGSLGLALQIFLTGFAGRQESFLRRVRTEGGQVTLLVAVTGPVSGFTITSAMSGMLERTGIDVEFEFAAD